MYRFIDRELSWLAFNHRVLQEARDANVSLADKIKFMAIFSSNLDEFFRIRVASLRNLLSLKHKSGKKLKFDAQELLDQIHHYVHKQQEELGYIYRNIIIKELRRNNIFIVNETGINPPQQEYIKTYFFEEVYPYIQPVLLLKNKLTVFLKNHALYLALRLYVKKRADRAEEHRVSKPKYAVIEIPSRHLPRFISLPGDHGRQFIIFLDDILRLCLPTIFHGYRIAESYAIKLTRDAEIYIEDEFSGDLVEKIKVGISKRKSGVPSRFLYDARMPKDFLDFLKNAFSIKKEDLVPGGRYHNYSDFFSFPLPEGKHLRSKVLIPLADPTFQKQYPLSRSIQEADHLVHFPYQSYEPVIRFIAEAAKDATVRSIYITLYRVASGSKIVEELIAAARMRKKVTVFVEVKARFDEESNIRWAKEMEIAGVRVIYSFPGLKVHAKCCLIVRVQNRRRSYMAYLSTGNFNEKTAEVYTDFGFFTADQRITGEIHDVFAFLEGKKHEPHFKHLLVAPFNLRGGLNKMIDQEIDHVIKRKPGLIILKLNNLEDRALIQKLYKASEAGVKIRILVRGICALIPGHGKFSRNISVYSIIDRFLEHSRIYIFGNNGQPQYWLASADWMERNLERRIEVAFPVYRSDIQEEIDILLSLQFADSCKLRTIDEKFSNQYAYAKHKHGHTAQERIYNYYKKRFKAVKRS